jgi:hypothetical protein
MTSNYFYLLLATYKEFYEWSIKNNVDFWSEFWHFSKIIHSKPYEQVWIQISVIRCYFLKSN